MTGASSPGGDPLAALLGRAPARALLALALLPWPVLLVVIGNQVASPDLSRGVVFETVRRLLEGRTIYPPPTGEFVAIDYNPLLYLLDAGAALVFGLGTATLRAVAAAGAIGAAAMVFLAVRRSTGSAAWGIAASGLFAGAYRAFDCYPDQAQPDAWMLCAAIAGLYLLQETGTWWRAALGVALLCASFWFKQQGALLAVGGVLYLTLRRGPGRAVPFWIIAALLGPAAWLGLGPLLFGGHFLYYTWEVPHGYSTMRPLGILHAGWYVARYWLVPAGVVVWGLLDRRRRGVPADVWTATFPLAVLIGLLGAIDYSEHNVYMAPATWLILLGVPALRRMAVAASGLPPAARPRAAAAIAAMAVASLAALAYDPREVLVPARARADYVALVQQVRGLGGNVYMPGVGQFPGDLRLPVAVHWVPLEDLVRGRGHATGADPLVRMILKDVLQPAGEAYVFADRPLEGDELLRFLAPRYELVEDLGDRYASLRSQPGWYSGRSWPRYLYRHRAEPRAPLPASGKPLGNPAQSM